jgi:hypothetical protein
VILIVYQYHLLFIVQKLALHFTSFFSIGNVIELAEPCKRHKALRAIFPSSGGITTTLAEKFASTLREV